MGQAKRRRTEIEAMKAAGLIRAEEQHATNRLACAAHESAHLIAAFHFDVPLGERGVHIRNVESSSEFVGFTDSLLPKVYGDLSKLSDERRTEYMAQTLIGPIAEYRLLGRRTDYLLSFWANDIAAALAIQVRTDHKRGIVLCDEVEECKILTTYCLTVIDDPIIPVPHVLRDNPLLSSFTNAAILAERIRKQYAATIHTFANALIKVPGMAFSSAQADDWKRSNFTRQVVK